MVILLDLENFDESGKGLAQMGLLLLIHITLLINIYQII